MAIKIIMYYLSTSQSFSLPACLSVAINYLLPYLAIKGSVGLIHSMLANVRLMMSYIPPNVKFNVN